MAKTLQEMRDKLEGFFDRLIVLGEEQIKSDYNEHRLRGAQFIETAAQICTAITTIDREIRLSKRSPRHINTFDK